MKGTCINASHSTELKQEQEYFLFPLKPNHFYVSRFDNKGANFGCYEADRFQVIEEEEWPKEPEIDIPELDKEKYYRADLIWRAEGYRDKELKRYVMKPSTTHCYVWHDKERKQFAGCFPMHWFRDFKLIIEQQSPQAVEQPIVLLERPNGQLAFF
ncbi:hypothetical protein [Bacillus thuringiensis]|uniref:Uncharacterized protein n=1 Tax=Bacillus thuringiensis TaxID=1428 RepID=A0A9X6Y751_BACTU|nr:hypothetical protein [Bacillus thuringiensis]PEA85892.1 hypothetical protein CON71_33105 [Bacillus thuringiensis]